MAAKHNNRIAVAPAFAQNPSMPACVLSAAVLSGPLSRWKESWLVWALCGVAALRVFVYAAAFPFFNNVDEGSLFDLVLKYSRLQPPSGMEQFSRESIPSLILFTSPEFGLKPDKFPDGKYPSPPWLHPSEPVRFNFAGSPSWWRIQINRESSSAPLYYGVAGLWMRLGRCFGLEKLALLYWIRFLNVPLSAALVWLGYSAARLVFPGQRYSRLGVPLLLAFFPQDIYYGIQSDTLSPLCFGAAFVGLVRWLQTDAPSLRLGALTGLALAATWLVKTTNSPLVGVAVLAVLIKSYSLFRAGRRRPALPALAVLLLCAALPIGTWCLWSLHAFGDLTGASAKIQALGWTSKPFRDWRRHPIFTPAGSLTFWSELMASFWRGEYVWHGRRLAVFAVDAFYWISSLLLPGVAVVSLFWEQPDVTSGQRQALWFSFWSFAASVSFLGFASIYFNFWWCPYPSADHPYFTSGRLLCGALIPFLLLYVYGLEKAFDPIQSGAARMLALGGVILLITISEFIVNFPVFSSEYNWFHL
jgi:hypothetical protein